MSGLSRRGFLFGTGGVASATMLGSVGNAGGAADSGAAWAVGHPAPSGWGAVDAGPSRATGSGADESDDSSPSVSVPEEVVPFDGLVTVEGEGTYRGRPFVIARYWNRIADVDGVEVLRRDGPVDDAEWAGAAIVDFAWGEAIGTNLNSESIATMDAIDRISERIVSFLGPLQDATTTVLGVQDRLTDLSYAGRSAWEVITESSTKLRVTMEAVVTLSDAIQEWYDDAATVTRTIPQFLHSIEQKRAGEDVPNSTLTQRTYDGRRALRQFRGQIWSLLQPLQTYHDNVQDALDELDRRLMDLEDIISDDIVAVSRRLLRELEEGFERLWDVVDRVLDPFERFAERVSGALEALDEMESRKREIEQRLDPAWKARRGARRHVYGTVLLYGVLGLVTVTPLTFERVYPPAQEWRGTGAERR